MRAANRDTVLWLLTTTALSLAFVVAGARNIDNFRPVSGDDAWIMSASYKLATHGILGSDLYAGLFNAEQHYFFNLPLHHYFQAAAFWLFGSGVAQARLPSLVSAVLLIWTTSWLAFRWYGVLAAFLTAALMTVWRSDVVALHPGLPLLSLARSGRYDLVAVAWIWISILLMDHLVRKPRRTTALLTGASVGIATLTQFFGIFVLPVIAIVWARCRKAMPGSGAVMISLVIGFAVVVFPYVMDVTRHRADWVGQNFTIRDPTRVQLQSRAFYVNNVLKEPQRFAHLTAWRPFDASGPQPFDRSFSTALLAIGIWPALAHLVVRRVAGGGQGDDILLLTIVVFPTSLALLDSTKAPLYAVMVLPSICLVMGALFAAVAQLITSRPHPLVRMLLAIALIAIFGIVLLDGLRAYRVDRMESHDASRYLDVGAKLQAFLPERAVVLGPNRWWWALHDHQYLSLNNIWRQWELASKTGEAEPRFASWIAKTHAQYIIVNNDTRADILRFPEPLGKQFRAFLGTSCRLIAEVNDPNYFVIQIYEITPGSADTHLVGSDNASYTSLSDRVRSGGVPRPGILPFTF